MLVRFILLIGLTLLIHPVQAHEGVDGVDEMQFLQIISGLLLVVFWFIYYVGAQSVPPTIERSIVFHGTSLVTALIVLVPVTGWIKSSSALHMAEHMLIMVVIVPLYILARPLPQWIAVSGWIGIRLCKPLLWLGHYPMRAAFIQGIILWFWHMPKFYNLALTSPWWHLFAHVSLVLSACVFWWSVLSKYNAVALLALLFTLMHTGMLGALLTFTQIPLYGDSRDAHDQQLAGLIMWVPGGFSYLVAAAWCSLYWFRRDTRTLG